MLIATDLDGTLIPPDALEVPAYTAGVLRRADAAGVPLVFVTARPLRWMESFWPHVGGHGVAVVSNGAITYDVRNRRITSLRGIEPGEGLALCAAIAKALPGARFAIECADGIRLDPHYIEPYPHPGAPRGPLDEIWTGTAVKVLVRNPEVGAGELHGRVADAAEETAVVTWSNPGLAEISAPGVTKAVALRSVCERMEVGASDVVAFGDKPNDLAMLAWAGTAYAVANAHESVLDAADHIAPACAEEGVAKVIEHLLDR